MFEANKLQGSKNFGVWKVKIRTVLKLEGLWDFVCFFVQFFAGHQVLTNQLNEGEGMEDAEAPEVIAEVVAANAPEVVDPKVIKNRKDKALAIIIMSIKDELIPYIANVQELNTCWENLTKLFESELCTDIVHGQQFALFEMSRRCTSE
jgi:hypothetical protein